MKQVKNVVGLVVALAMILCLAVSAYAVNTETTPNQSAHTIIIDNAKESHTYVAYQIFRGDVETLTTETTETVLTNITWGSGVDATKIDALVAALKADPTIGTDMTNADYANLSTAEAVAYVVNAFEDNSQKLDAFAQVVGAYLSDTYFSSTEGEIDVTGDGYYLMMDGQDVSADDAYTKYLLEVTNTTEVTVSAKTDAPTLDKTFADGTDIVSGSVGQIVNFKLSSEVPDMDGYNKYFFIVHDTLDNGLTFNNDLEITITSKDGTSSKKLTADTYDEGEGATYLKDYALNVSEDGQTLEIVFRNFIDYKTTYPGGAISITYSATIDEDVDITAEGNQNTAYLEFSNNPNYDYEGIPGDPDDPGEPDKPNTDEPTGKTPNCVVTVYATAIKLTKINEDSEILTGAKFSIAGEAHTAYMINNQVFVKDNTNGTYYRLMDGTYTTTAPTETNTASYDGTDKYILVENVTVETGEETGIVAEGWVQADGTITFTGLGAGTYTITEIKAPAGYNLLDAPIEITLAFAWDEDTDAPVWTITKNGTVLEADDVTIDNNYISFNVVNKAGTTLPATGGIGTTIFYIVGAVLVLGAVVLLVTRKRMSTEN